MDKSSRHRWIAYTDGVIKVLPDRFHYQKSLILQHRNIGIKY